LQKSVVRRRRITTAAQVEELDVRRHLPVRRGKQGD
jgi:hypothetical protein